MASGFREFRYAGAHSHKYRAVEEKMTCSLLVGFAFGLSAMNGAKHYN